MGVFQCERLKKSTFSTIFFSKSIACNWTNFFFLERYDLGQ